MAKRIAVNTLNASTIDILNVIRQNASYEYQSSVPVVAQATDIPRVGEVIYGTPALANQFLNALINRIALVRVQSATFNNPYAALKKGYLEFGETVEEIFVNIARVVDYNPEKAEAREFKRTLPDVKSAFHTINWRVMYPVTIQDEDLKKAFLSMSGVQELIAKIVDQIYTAANNDEFLLFKYMLIKAISSGKFYPVSVGDGTSLSNAAVQFRGISNLLPFMSTSYNESGVSNTTPKNRQVIFMDAMFNAQFDVDVLSAAFNMDKADFMGRLYLIDNWTTFDNKRFATIRENSDGIEEVTQEELALLANVKAILVDEEWFQVYDNLNKFTETYVSSGIYWNYFYHTWKTVSHSPFANAVVFVSSEAVISNPASLTVTVQSKDTSDKATTLSLTTTDSDTLQPTTANFIQTQEAAAAGIGILPYGAILIPAAEAQTEITLEASIGNSSYKATAPVTSAFKVGDTIEMNVEAN